jgi:hypothetical protein
MRLLKKKAAALSGLCGKRLMGFEPTTLFMANRG